MDHAEKKKNDNLLHELRDVVDCIVRFWSAGYKYYPGEIVWMKMRTQSCPWVAMNLEFLT